MASAYEVNLVAGRVKNAYSEIDRKRERANAAAKEASIWWQGSTSEAFAQEYNRINNDIHALLDMLSALEKQLKTVAIEIVNAEEAALAASRNS